MRGQVYDQAVVPVCLKPGQLYNVEEGLAPAILHAVPRAQRVRYLRCLRQFHVTLRRDWRAVRCKQGEKESGAYRNEEELGKVERPTRSFRLR